MERKENPIVETVSGKLEGTYENNLYVFKGVPFAAPPVGALRWMPPQPVAAWSGVRPAHQFGPISLQPPTQMSLRGGEPENEPQSEDCLYLNVYTPGLDEGKRAVMVWIHGGGYSMGSGSSRNNPGSTLPAKGDVVFVSLNYRLGMLGFLHLNELTGGKIPATGNEGLLDQIAAVKWVRDNIAAFGGDPENITVFGESAGAMSIGGLLAMPAASGTFQKAILQSGANTVRPLNEAIKVAELFLKELGLNGKDADALMSLPPGKIIDAQATFGINLQQPGIKGAPCQPVVEGNILPDYPLNAMANGSAGNVKILAGSNLDEMKIFLMMRPPQRDIDENGVKESLSRLLPAEYIPGLIDSYRNARQLRGADTSPDEILTSIQTDLQFRMPGIKAVEAQTTRGIPSYNYLFTWESCLPGMGSCHALDVGFVFGNLSDKFEGTGPEADSLAGKMQDAWRAFAKTGNPSCNSLGVWPVYGTNRTTMILDKECRLEHSPLDAERRAWDDVPNMYLR